MHDVRLAVAQHDVGAAIAAWNVVRLPGPERGLMDLAIGRDLQGRIPEGSFLLPELAGDGPKRRLASLDPSLIFGAGQPEIQLQRISRLGRLAKGKQADEDAERRAKPELFQR